MTRKSKARYGLKRTYKLNPTVKALRNALMAGMMAAAIAPSVALARNVAIEDVQFPGVYIYNSTNLYASDYDVAAGIVAGSFGDLAEVVNTGGIYIQVYNNTGLDTLAAGIYAKGSYGGVVDNSGNISISNNTNGSGDATSWGIFAGDFGGAAAIESTVYNEGVINITSSTDAGDVDAFGIKTLAAYEAEITNFGDVTISTSSNSGDASAYGLAADSTLGNATVYNYTGITVSASSQAGDATAVGLEARALKYAYVYNTGDITASSESVFGDVASTGIISDGLFDGAYVYNFGELNISASTQYGSAEAIGIDAYSYYDVATVFNNGDINVSASVAGISNIYTPTDTTANAYGINVSAYGEVVIDNSGNITLSASNNLYLGASTAVGINVDAYNGASITNSGDIVITASSGGGASYAFVQDPSYTLCGYYNCYVTYEGTIDTAGIRSDSEYGVTTITNSGDITITDLNPDGGFLGNLNGGDYLKGIDAFNNMGDVIVNNSGNIVLEGGKWDFGIIAQTGTTIGVKNTYIEGYGYYDLPYFFGGGDVSVVNSGNITITTDLTHPLGWLNYRASIGIAATTDLCGSPYPWLDASVCGGDISVLNSGELNITNTGSGGAVGIAAYTGFNSDGNVYVGNSGEMNILGTEFATGIAVVTDTGDVYIKNSADITTTTNTAGREGRATGIRIVSNNASNITVLNSGEIVSNGDIAASGINANSRGGDVSVESTGIITTESTDYYTLYSYYRGGYYAVGGNASGIRVSTIYAGNSSVINSGDLEVYGVINAYGIITNAKDSNSYTKNTGNISVSNGDNNYAGNVYGIIAQASGFSDYYYGDNDGYTTVLNSGDITANGTEFAVAIKATQFYGAITVENSGEIVADSTNRAARGILTTNAYGSTNILNTGNITVTGPGSAVAISAYSTGCCNANYYGDIYVASSGNLTASSEYNRASAIEAQSTYGSIDILTYGTIDASAYERAFSIDARTVYGEISIENHANVSAESSTEFAVGIRAQSNYGDVSVSNYADVSASGYSLTQGIVALSYYGNAFIINNGDVTASSSDGYSQAVALRSGSGGKYTSALINSGSISDDGSEYSVAISATGGDSFIYNEGLIAGSIITDYGQDVILNKYGGQIVLTDDVINLYGGDGIIINDEYSTISMDNSTIEFGDGYNAFYNDGELIVNGTNTIDMGYSEGGNTFYNNGNSIHMEDGAADDELTIIGNFAGTGSIFVDVDGLTLNSDRLYIDGDVDSGTENIIDVNLLSMPSAAAIEAGATIPIVTVTGVNAPGNFVLGDVHLDSNALFTADYTLVRETPTTDFSLAFEVTGLTTAGVLLSTVSPAAQNLWFSSLGTMYMRQGAERSFEAAGQADVKGAAGTWLRAYANDGSMSPDAKRSNFGDVGSQDYSLSSSGIEAGFGYSFNSAWTVGVFGGINQGDYKPDVGGKVSLDGNTWGGYVTFTPGNGFYADLSYRDIGFDGDALNNGSKEQLDGDASGFSLEMGYGFKMQSGLEIEPQLQYSAVSVDLDNVAYTSGGFELTDGDAAQLRIGSAFRKTFNQDNGVWVPYGAVSYIQNYDGTNNYLIGGALEGEVDISGGSVLLELGTDARYGDFDFNLGVGWQDGGAYNSVLNGQVNVRYSW